MAKRKASSIVATNTDTNISATVAPQVQKTLLREKEKAIAECVQPKSTVCSPPSKPQTPSPANDVRKSATVTTSSDPAPGGKTMRKKRAEEIPKTRREESVGKDDGRFTPGARRGASGQAAQGAQAVQSKGKLGEKPVLRSVLAPKAQNPTGEKEKSARGASSVTQPTSKTHDDCTRNIPPKKLSSVSSMVISEKPSSRNEAERRDTGGTLPAVSSSSSIACDDSDRSKSSKLVGSISSPPNVALASTATKEDSDCNNPSKKVPRMDRKNDQSVGRNDAFRKENYSPDLGVLAEGPPPGLPAKPMLTQYIDRLGRSHDYEVRLPRTRSMVTTLNIENLFPPSAGKPQAETSRSPTVVRQTNVKINKICRNWLDYQCPWQERCYWLHQPSDEVCPAYLADRCPFNDKCRRAHPPIRGAQHAADESLPLLSLLDGLRTSSSAAPLADADRDVLSQLSRLSNNILQTGELCLLQLRGRCHYSHCRRHHLTRDDVNRLNTITSSIIQANETRKKLQDSQRLELGIEADQINGPNPAPVRLPVSELQDKRHHFQREPVKDTANIGNNPDPPETSLDADTPSEVLLFEDYWDSKPDYSGWHFDSRSSDSGTDVSTATSSTAFSTPTRSSASVDFHGGSTLSPQMCRQWCDDRCSRADLCRFPYPDIRHAHQGQEQKKLRQESEKRQVSNTSNCFYCTLGLCTGTAHLHQARDTHTYPLVPPGLSRPQAKPRSPQPEPLPPPKVSSQPLRQRELLPNLTVTVLDYTKVKLGAGFEVLDVKTGFESRWVYLENIPPYVTQAAITEVLQRFGHVTQINTLPQDVSSVTAKVQFSEPAEALQAASSLNGAQVFQSVISSRLAINNTNQGNGVLRDTSVRLTWEAPVRIGYAGYPTLEEAQAAIQSADGFEIKGHRISAELYEGTPAIDCCNVRFLGLPPFANETTLQKFAPAHSIMLQRPNYASLDTAIRGLRRLLEEHGEIISFQVLPPPYKDGMVKAWAHFVSPHIAQSVHNALGGRKWACIGRTKLRTRHVQDVSYRLPRFIYEKLSSDIFALGRFAWERGLNTFVSVVDQRTDTNASVCIKLSGDNARELGQMKSQFEKVLRGDRVLDHGKAVWDGFFNRPSGFSFLRELEQQNPGAWIQTDPTRRTISVIGHPEHRAVASRAILDKVAHLRAQQLRYIPLSGRAIGVFMSADLMELQQELGPENVQLDLLGKRLIVRGNNTAYEAVQDAVHRAQQCHKGQQRENAVGCPVCFDDVTSPVTLDCGHSWCRSCLSSYLVASKDNKLFPLTCLGNDATCSQPLSLSVAQDLLSADDFEAVVNASFMAYVHSRTDEFHYCPTPDCPQVYRVAPGDIILQCPSCLIRICSKCHIEYHDGLTCEERDNDGEKLFKEWRETHGVKNCPGCKAHIQRSEGCNHMTCTRCQTHICWVCMATFPRGEGIYDHMRMTHGGIGL